VDAEGQVHGARYALPLLLEQQKQSGGPACLGYLLPMARVLFFHVGSVAEHNVDRRRTRTLFR